MPARFPSRCLTDAALTSRSARGDAAAFAVVYKRHHQALYRYCRSILRHDEDARDALQSTMLKSFAALQTDPREIELKPWLFRIAHNEAISILRRRRPSEPLDAALDRGDNALERSVESRSRLMELRADLADLPEKQRAALVLRELSGLSHDEIAVVIDSTPRAVKQTIFEARTAMYEFRAGRDTDCHAIRQALSNGDGRVLRARRMRSHLRSCDGCRGFRSELQHLPAELAALAPPLPLAAGAALLAHLLPGGTGAASTSAAGAGATSTMSGGLLTGVAGKAAMTAAVAATAAGGGAITIAAVSPATARHRLAEASTLRPPRAQGEQEARRNPISLTGTRDGRSPGPAAPAARSAPGLPKSAQTSAPAPLERPAAPAMPTASEIHRPQEIAGHSTVAGKAAGHDAPGNSAARGVPGKPAAQGVPGKAHKPSSAGKSAKHAARGKPSSPGKSPERAAPDKPVRGAPETKRSGATPQGHDTGTPAAPASDKTGSHASSETAAPKGRPPSTPAASDPAQPPAAALPQTTAPAATTPAPQNDGPASGAPADPSANAHGRASRP